MEEEVNIREFADKWLKKYHPYAKKTQMVDCFYDGKADDGSRDVRICFNRKVDEYDTWNFSENYMRSFLAGKED